jgi:hypothetical protein
VLLCLVSLAVRLLPETDALLFSRQGTFHLAEIGKKTPLGDFILQDFFMNLCVFFAVFRIRDILVRTDPDALNTFIRKGKEPGDQKIYGSGFVKLALRGTD